MCLDGKITKSLRVAKSKALITYRAWHRTSDGSLDSFIYFGPNNWGIGQESKADAAPTRRNENGFYCFKRSAEAREYAQSWRNADVFGQVKIWGRVQEYSNGYRAEYATITKFLPLHCPPKPVKKKAVKKTVTKKKGR